MPLSIAQIAEANKAVVRRYYEEFWTAWDATAFAQQLGGDQPQATTTT